MPTKGARDNFSGDISVTAPTGGYAAGGIYQLASGAWCVARETVSAGAACLVGILNDQPIWVTKVTGTGKSFSVGSKVYRTGATVTPSATGNTLVGVAVKAAGISDTEVLVIGCQALGPAAT